MHYVGFMMFLVGDNVGQGILNHIDGISNRTWHIWCWTIDDCGFWDGQKLAMWELDLFVVWLS